MMRHLVNSVVLALMIAGVFVGPSWGQQTVASRTDAATAAKIHAALDKKTQIEFLETPLAEVVEFISQLHDVDVALDMSSLEDLGVGSDTPITLSAKGVSLRSALRLMLNSNDLDYTIRHGALQITSREETESQMINRVYRVDDLLEAGGAKDDVYDYDSLTEVIESTVAVDFWDNVGGPASMDGLLGNLVVSQTIHNHREVHAFLSTYRKALKEIKAADGKPLPGAYLEILPSKLATRIRGQLDSPVTVEFVETPLSEVAEFISQLSNVPVILDTTSLDEVGIGSDMPVTLTAKDARIRDVLGRLLKPLNLTYMIRDETLQITTFETLEANLSVRLYPINDMLSGEKEDRALMMDDIIGVVSGSIAPDTWDDVGGPSSIDVLQPGILAISQTDETHEDIATLLSTLRKQGVKPKVNSKELVTRVYMILDAAKPGNYASPETVAQLAMRVSALVSDVDWKSKGVLVEPLGASLIVKQTRANHRKLLDFMVTVGLQYRVNGGFIGGSMIPVVGQPGSVQQGGGMFGVPSAKPGK